MPPVVQSFGVRTWSKAALVAACAAAMAGCSAESTRFDNPNASPYASRRPAPAPEVTGSVSAAPVARVESQPLHSAALPPPSATRPATVPAAGVSGGGRGIGSYHPAAYTPGTYTPAPAPVQAAAPGSSDITGTVAARPAPPPQPAWQWDGGTAVIVGHNETLDSLSRKYNVPGRAILQANNLSGPASLRAGQRIVIPRQSAAPAAAPRVAAPQPAPQVAPVAVARPAPAPAPTAVGNVHIVAPGETLISISRSTGRGIAEIAAANRIAPHTKLKIGDRLVIPGGARTAQRPAAPAAPAPVAQVRAPVVAAAPQIAAPRVAASEPTQTARLATPAAEAVADEPKATGAATSFRWPVRGRVISGFGAKPNGQPNDGINLAVPEGTAVRAAEDGVVAYAGNELKGYGNLILVRHANGYVTAYAHASEIMVKRNDTVRRGQVIAKSGQSGTVSSPQLHFEIRKGATPIDPMPLLPAGA